MQTTNRETIPIGTRITETMQKGVEQVLLADGHVNKADYLRDLIRKDLEKRGLLNKNFEDKETDKCQKDNDSPTDVTTIKLTSPNLVLLSKLKRFIKSRLENAFESESSILVSSETNLYFCFVNFNCDALTELLLDLTPYPTEPQQ